MRFIRRSGSRGAGHVWCRCYFFHRARAAGNTGYPGRCRYASIWLCLPHFGGRYSLAGPCHNPFPQTIRSYPSGRGTHTVVKGDHHPQKKKKTRQARWDRPRNQSSHQREAAEQPGQRPQPGRTPARKFKPQLALPAASANSAGKGRLEKQNGQTARV
jgi:hypothetical protein